jgi:hypothetical protein
LQPHHHGAGGFATAHTQCHAQCHPDVAALQRAHARIGVNSFFQL